MHHTGTRIPMLRIFARAPRGAGYAHDIVHGPRGAAGHRFTRDAVGVRVDTGRREDPQAEEIRMRVSRVMVDTPGVAHG